MQFSKADALTLVKMMRSTLNEKFERVDNNLKAVETKMPYDLSTIAEDFKFISDFLCIEKTAQKSSCQLDILDALTRKSFRLRVA